MEKIASFTIDHIRLQPGVYVSRKDQVGDSVVTTFDLRMTSPNEEPVMNTAEVHALEHVAATYLRNQETWSDRIVYVGPMGCRTGFYFLVTGMEHGEVIELIREIFSRIAVFDDAIPGAACSAECGNYQEHDLPGAREWAARFLPVIESWTPEQLKYAE